MKRILYTSREVREAIIQLFSSGLKRRVAITAFVGEGAETYLPKSKGLELICWPKEGGTNPQAIRTLMKLGVHVSFCESLHMKVYWAEDQGTVITSANLSTNALGSGDLKEIGVLLGADEFDIDSVMSSLRTRPVTRSGLQKLDRRHNLYLSKNSVRTKAETVSFHDWYESHLRSEWKFACVQKPSGNVSQRVKEILKAEYGAKQIGAGLHATGEMFRKGDWILEFTLRKDSPGPPTWMFADFSVRVPQSDEDAYDSKYPYQVIQVWPISRYAGRPFVLDERFKRAFAKSVQIYGASRIRKMDVAKPPRKLLDLVYEHYQRK